MSYLINVIWYNIEDWMDYTIYHFILFDKSILLLFDSKYTTGYLKILKETERCLAILLCKDKRQYLLTCKVRRYCLLALHGRAMPKGSICSLYKWADTAFWFCRAVKRRCQGMILCTKATYCQTETWVYYIINLKSYRVTELFCQVDSVILRYM